MTTQNAVLARLPDAVRSSLVRQALQVQLVRGQVLGSSDCQLRHTYFPVAGLISIAGLTEAGGTVELAAVGSDGFIGPDAFPSCDRVPHQAVVQLPGTALRVELNVFRTATSHDNAAQQVLSDHAGARSAEVALGVVCQCYHTALQRLCRWLLSAVDRTGCDTIAITHESLGGILGVLRPVVTKASIELQDASAVWTRRGRITVLNRRMLEMSACECYQLLRSPAVHAYHVTALANALGPVR